MARAPIGVGIIGCGAIAQRRHAPEYDADPRCRLIGCTDFLPERRKELADAHHCKTFSTLNELLADPAIEAVSICTMNSTHTDTAIAALEAGKHVLIEKPMAMTANEAQAMLSAAEKVGKLLIPAHNQRLFPGHRKARDVLQSGMLGDVLSFESVFSHSGPENWCLDRKGAWFFDPEKAGLGVISDLAVHKADAVNWLLGMPFSHVACHSSGICRKLPGLHEHAEILCRTDSGITGVIRASWCNFGAEENKTDIFCRKGVLRINPCPGCDLRIETSDSLQELDLGGISTNEKQISSGVISAFLDAVLDGASPFADGRDGLLSAMFTDACSRSLKSGAFEALIS